MVSRRVGQMFAQIEYWYNGYRRASEHRRWRGRVSSPREGEHPALGPVPFRVPPARCLIASSSGKTGRAHVAVSRGSIERTEAVRPFPVPVVVRGRRWRDLDTGIEPGEPTGP